jgi:hypothetical protein
MGAGKYFGRGARVKLTDDPLENGDESMERGIRILAVVAVCTTLAQPNLTTAQAPIPAQITTPNLVETRIAPLDLVR